MSIPYRIFSSYPVNQLLIGEQLSTEFQQSDRKVRFGPFKCCLSIGSRGIDCGA